MNRREFLCDSVMLGASMGIPRKLGAILPRPRLDSFAYSAVKLGDSVALAQREQTHRVLMEMDLNRALRPFRLRAGMEAPGEELGGWYSSDGFAPGHAFGQWLSALSRYAAATGDAAAKKRVSDWVAGYANTITAEGMFYRDNRFPSYTYDKLVGGLVDAYVLGGDRDALSTLERTTDSAEPYLPPHAVARRETPVLHGEDFTEHCWDESYTLPENLFRAYEATGHQRYLRLAKRFLFDDEFFAPLARGENVLPGRHAYSHVNALGSAAKAYMVLGSRLHLEAAQHGMQYVRDQSFATSGWGPDEHFVPPGTGKLGDSLRAEHHSFETPCGSYAHFKLSRYLLEATRETAYGDSMEQVLYNCAWGALPLQASGRAFYYSDYTAGARKGFHPDLWPCCSGTLPQLAADYGVNTYFRDGRNVYVNLYLPSTLRWRNAGANLELTQTGEYPLSEAIEFSLKADSAQRFSVFLRIPGWANRGGLIRVSGERAREFVPGAWAEISREWKDGDRFTLELPMTNRLQAVDKYHTNLVALAHGPMVLFAVDAAQNTITGQELLSAKRSGASGWTATSREQLRLQPWWLVDPDQQYWTYVPIAGS